MASAAVNASNRELVTINYNSAEVLNSNRFLKNDDKATQEYIYANQKEDAFKIVDMFINDDNLRLIAVMKKTKVGADGLMIEIAKLFTTHPDDDKIIQPENIRIITGMSNRRWEMDMIGKSPECFRKNIFHHGKLSKCPLTNMKNSLIIIDEIDSGDKPEQVLHTTLKNAGILNVEHMKTNNNRFVVISATMIAELHDLLKWKIPENGDRESPQIDDKANAAIIYMSIPNSYIGHTEFLKLEIIKEWYPMNTLEQVVKWIDEDIIQNYKNEYRIHIARINEKKLETFKNACNQCNVALQKHFSDEDRSEEIEQWFTDAQQGKLTRHVLIVVKGLLRRANLIPDKWKMCIGAVHELYTKLVDDSVQIQGLIGRLTGHWRHQIICDRHKTGPYRTSIQAIKDYESYYYDPSGNNPYRTSNFSKKRNKPVVSKGTMLSSHNVGLGVQPNKREPEMHCEDTMYEMNTYFKNLFIANPVHAKFRTCKVSKLRKNSKSTFDDIWNDRFTGLGKINTPTWRRVREYTKDTGDVAYVAFYW